MARRTAAELARKLIARGLPADTPALVATNISRPDEAALPTTVAGLVEGDACGHEAGPTLVIIGAAVDPWQVRPGASKSPEPALELADAC
jgi:siroheme synthase